MGNSYGRLVPDFNFTDETSDALIVPLHVTSSRKLASPTNCPTWDFVSVTSVAFTEALLVFASPNEHSHRDIKVAHIGTIAHPLQRYRDLLRVSYSGEVDGNSSRPAAATAAN